MIFKLFKWILVLLMLAIVGGVIALQFLTFNQFKDIAAQKVRAATGRNLEIPGDIKVSFYPVFGAKIDRITLSNVLGSKESSMISIQKLVIGVKLVPLIHERIELEKIVIDKPVVHLEKDLAGKGNWEFTKTADVPTAADASKTSQMKVTLHNIQINDGAISYLDAKSDQPVEISKLNAFITMTDLDSLLRINADVEVGGAPVRLSLTTNSPNALMSEKGSPTNLEAMIFGIPAKMQGLISVTPKRASVSGFEFAVQQILGKGKIDVALGGPTAVLNANLDFGDMNLDALTDLASATNQAAPAAPGTDAPAAPVAKKKYYIDPLLFKSVEGSLAVSAESIESGKMKIAQPRFRANMGSGIIAAAAVGAISTDTQAPTNVTFTSADIAAMLRAEGSAFSLTATLQNKDISADGRLALVPGLTSLSDLTLKLGDQTLTGKVSLEDKSGNQAFLLDMQWLKNNQSWHILASSPAVNKMSLPEGTDVKLLLQSLDQRVELETSLSNADKMLRLDPLKITLNKGAGDGFISLDQKTPVPMLNANIEFSELDLNPILSFLSNAGDSPANGTASGTAASAPSKDTPLKNMNAQITIRSPQLKIKNVLLSNIDLIATIKDGVMEVTLPNAGLYKGKTNLKARVDGNTPDPKFTINTDGNGVDLGNVLSDAIQSNLFSGTMRWNAKISGTGFNPPAMYQTLGGEGEFEMQEGVIRGMDLLVLMSALRADLGAESLIQNTKETNHLHATGTFHADKGIISSTDLVLQSPNLEASGKGAISLPMWQIDARLEPKIGEHRNGGAGEKFVGQSVAVNVKGPLDHPKIRPDTGELIDKGVDAIKSIKGVKEFLKKTGLDDSAPATNVNDDGLPAASGDATQQPKKKKSNWLKIFEGQVAVPAN